MEKIINYFELEVSASLKASETPSGKPLLHKDRSSLGRKCVWNYISAVCMLSYLWISTRPNISMAIHQCACFCNNPRLVHEHAVRIIANYLASTSTYVDFSDGNRQLTTRDVVYKPNIKKVIECYVDV